VRLKSYFSQIYTAMLLIALLSVVSITWITSRSWRHFYLDELAGDLEARARLAAVQVGEKLARGETDKLDALCKDLGKLTQTRLTVVLRNGRVAGDSLGDPNTMEDHGGRPEIQAALAGKSGVGPAGEFHPGPVHDVCGRAGDGQGQTPAVVRTSCL
jgi:two-component system, OmpR family, phosphate regulon sensor histidine kinase PhoR